MAKKQVKKSAKTAKEKNLRKGPSLLVVESPAKERTISRFLKNDFIVKSSFGHVRDLPVRKIGVNVEDDFAPQYVVLPRAKKILKEFKGLASKAAYVYLATDHDREGESIAWHLVDMLKLKSEQVRRITFHEITPGAIKEAIASPRAIDENLVHAQQARRVIDRLVGYKLSPLLWTKIQSGLSAGRVQSVAVRLLAEREREIQDFKSEGYWTLTSRLEKPGQPTLFDAKLSLWQAEKVETTRTYDLFSEQYRVKATTLGGAEDVDKVCVAIKDGTFKVVKVEKKEVRRRPAPPFSTSTLQQAASQKMGFAAERTMRVAQSLYEGVDLGGKDPVGLITYMRTDSFSIAKTAAVECADYISEAFGAAFRPAEPPTYQTKSRGAQEAHEAIRPTSVLRTPNEVRRFLNADQIRLYELVWKRFMASQMVEAVYDTASADIENDGALFHCTGRTLKFEGFLRVYRDAPKSVDEEEGEDLEEEGSRLPPLAEGDVLRLVELRPEEHKTSPPPHYNEASLIRAMEKHGIGRPSTYAPTIKTIVNRGYVRRNIKDRKLIPSDLGVLVTEKLKAHFPEVVSLTYTAEVEEKLDLIAEGKSGWTGVVREFYAPFIKALEAAATEMEASRIEPKMSDELCPVCAAPMLIRESRFGKYLSCSTFPKCKGKIQLTPEGQKVVLEMTGENCDLCAKAMVIRAGRKGRFMACSGYPDCKNTFSLDADGKKIEGSRPLLTARPCNKCGKHMWLRTGKRGFFLTCPGYPKCRNLKPVSKDEGEKLKTDGEALRAAMVAQRQVAGGASPAD
ncbi:MAG TPA: type I DNA topoisomerase [Elusimicrobia bacterium]|nr:MAG: DNA topoisomerase I [Elusimicrobia bacterium GWA2_66_18]OGR72837.1 MAG: DNA topoisomerase I [Elusimicrobia bacterium GWC2_65_9]HAZ07551.1 type I DNA topoisomerase [Elusimicrobiota bacterium]